MKRTALEEKPCRIKQGDDRLRKRNVKKRVVEWLWLFACICSATLLIHILVADETTKAKPSAEVAAKQNEKKETENPTVRVLIRTQGFQDEVHPSVSLCAGKGLVVTYGDKTEEIKGGETLAINPDDARFSGGKVTIQGKEGDKITILSLKRGYGNPSYRGQIDLYSTAEGIAVVNALPMEQYLYGVVPSEMPASYELEALKCQAVCARSYAYCQIRQMAYPEYEANIDDSTSYQVYNNSAEQEKSNQAVDETCGQKLIYKGNVVNAYYYSTSCGKTTDMDAWGGKNDSNAYLAGVAVSDGKEDYEKDLPWYRWSASVAEKTMSDLISLNTKTDIGNLQNIEVTKRGAGDIALEIVATGDKGSATVKTENKIRRALAGNYTVQKQDGSTKSCGSLLPSAFFTITKENGFYKIEGGGYGHGIGMSQNGANEMAKNGKNYQEILGLFYQDVQLEQ